MSDLRPAALDFAFPNGDHAPTELSEFALVLLVTFRIARQLLLPELSPRRRYAALVATRMPVPEAAVHEDQR